MKRLIVNADDLGYAAGIDAGILRAHREGIVTSASLMTNLPRAERAAALARATPTLDVGVHLVITNGRPLSDPATVPSLLGPDGAFRRPRELIGLGARASAARSLRARIRAQGPLPLGPLPLGSEQARVRTDEVLREFRAQYARGREMLGREPSHLDTHHWVEEHPAVLEAFLSLARETGAAVRSLTPAIRERSRAAGIRTPDAYRRDFQHAGHIDVPSLLAILASLADRVTELGCHPGEPDVDLEARSSYARERPVELATLTDPAARARLDELGIELTTFREL